MPVDLQSRRIVRFPPFEVDIRAGELRKNGTRIRLQGQPLQVLRLLLESAGDVVTREELKEKLWPADTFVGFDDGLNTAVKKLRDALGDSAEQPRYIETLPRRGYRFIGAVVQADEAAGDLRPSIQEASPRGGPIKWWTWAAAGLGVVLLGLLGWMAYRNRRPVSAGDTSAIRSIAVLPLQNLSSDPAQDYFAAGLTDTLTTDLARIGSLRVISHSSAVKYKDKPLSQIARELQVDAIIEGSVAKSGDRVRVNVQLIQASTDKHLWAESYDRDLRDVLAIQNDIATAVAQQVRIAISPQAQARMLARSRVNPQAHDLYLRAMGYLGQENPGDNGRATDLLEKAVADDPTFALAYAALAIEYKTSAAQFRDRQQEFRERSSVAVEKALALDPDLPEAYLARGLLMWTKNNHFPHQAAIADLEHALALNPNLSEAHHQLANIYNHIGLLDRARDQIQRAVSLDPTNRGARFRVGINLQYQGRWEDALLSMRDSQGFFPSLWAYQTAFALVQLGRIDEARQIIHDAVHQDTPEVAGLLESMEAMLAAKAGKTAEAEADIRAAILRGEQFQHFHHVAYGIASAYSLMNRREQALLWLRKTADDGFPCYPLFTHDRNLDNLRQDPRFVEWMQQLERQWKQYAMTALVKP